MRFEHFSAVHAPNRDRGGEKSYENFPSGADVVSFATLEEGVQKAADWIHELRRKHSPPTIEIVADKMGRRPVDVLETFRRLRDRKDINKLLDAVSSGKKRYENYLKLREAILELYKEKRGYTVDDLAKKMSVSKSNAQGYLRQLAGTKKREQVEELFGFTNPLP